MKSTKSSIKVKVKKDKDGSKEMDTQKSARPSLKIATGYVERKRVK